MSTGSDPGSAAALLPLPLEPEPEPRYDGAPGPPQSIRAGARARARARTRTPPGLLHRQGTRVLPPPAGCPPRGGWLTWANLQLPQHWSPPPWCQMRCRALPAPQQ